MRITKMCGVLALAAGVAWAMPIDGSLLYKHEVDPKSSSNITRFLRAHSKDPVVAIYIDSYGGFISDMNVIIKEMGRYQKRGGLIVCTVFDWAASAAAAIYSKCDAHLARPGATLLFHSVQLCERTPGNKTCHPADPRVPEEREAYEEGQALLQYFGQWLTDEEREAFRNREDVIIPASVFIQRVKESRL